MSLLEKLRDNYRYAAGIRAFLRHPVAPAEARRWIEERFRTREESFLKVAETAIYGVPSSPYLKLLRHAGIEMPELRRLVAQLGLEGALQRLYDAGVYVTLDEFKGRAPVRRDGLEFAVKQSDFNSANVGPGLEAATSGSRGAPAPVQIDFQQLTREAGYLAWYLDLAGLGDRPIAAWGPGSAMRPVFYAKAGKRLEKDFSTIPFRRSRDGLRAAILNAFTRMASKLQGTLVPNVEFVPREDVVKIASWLAEQRALGRPALMMGNASPAIRICLAARQHRLDIADTIFLTSGEPYTAGKAEIVASVGARMISSYAMMEMLSVGYGCLAPAELDEVHLLTDKMAVMQQERMTSAGTTVPALFFTGVAPNFSKVLLNFECGDYGTISQRDCGCPLQDAGFTTHLSGIRSHEKLTSEGVTFVGTELYELLEQVLPARFGGRPTEYQLVEEEHDGIPRVSIVVAPSVGPVDEDAIVETVLRTLSKYRTGGGEVMSSEWRQGETLSVVRREPYETRTAKILPLHILRQPAAASAEGVAAGAAGQPRGDAQS